MTKDPSVERLDPTPNTKRKLYSLSGGCCAFPDCNKFLFDNDAYIGTICHIESAKPSGPRFNKTQTDEDRRNYDNLIILCKNHHTIVDTDVETYAVETLKEMKKKHELLYSKTNLVLNQSQETIINLEEEILKLNHLGSTVELHISSMPEMVGSINCWKVGYFRDEDIQSNFDVRRPIVDNIESELNGNHSIMIFGDPFSGKSMILKRVMLDYLEKDFKVLLFKNNKANYVIINKLLSEAWKAFGDKLIVIADDLHNPGSIEIFKAMDIQTNLKYVLSARKQDFINMQENLNWNDSEIIRSVLEKTASINITFTEIDAQYFFKKINDLFSKQYDVEWIMQESKRLADYSKGDLMIFISALLQDINSSFENLSKESDPPHILERHVKEEYHRIDDLDHGKIFSCMFLGMCGLPLDEEKLFDCNIFTEDLKKLQNCNLIIFDGSYKIKHELWGLKFLQYLFKSQFDNNKNRFKHSKANYLQFLNCIMDKLDLNDLYKVFDICRNITRENDSQGLGHLIESIITDHEYNNNSLLKYEQMADFYCYGIGNYYLLTNQFVKAKAFYEKSLKHDEEHTSALNNMGSVYLVLNEYPKALEFFNRCLTVEPGIHINNNIIFTMIKQGKYEEAIKQTDELISQNPNNFELWNNRGLAMYYTNNFSGALECFDKCLTFNSNYKNAYVNRGLVLQRLNKNIDAINAFDKALDLDRYYVEAHFNKGNSLQELEEYDESIKCFDKTISINPNYIDALINMGISYFKKGLFLEAIDRYDRALRLNPDDFVLNYNKIQALSKINKVNSALEICDKLKDKLLPTDLYVLLLEEANLHEKSNNQQKSLACFDKAISINPKEIYAWQNKAAFLYKYNNKPKALECYDKIIQLDPGNIDIHEIRAKILMEIGDIQGLLNSLTSLINLRKNNPIYWYERAMIYIQINRITETLADLKITFQLDGNYRTKALTNALFKDILHLIKDL